MADAAVSKTVGLITRVGSNPTFGTSQRQLSREMYNVGAWLRLVERRVRVAEVGGSNPLAPTSLYKERPCLYRTGALLLSV